MKGIKYYLTIIISVLAFLSPALGIGFWYLTHDLIGSTPAIAIGAGIAVVGLGSSKFLGARRAQYRQDVEYDEFGRPKKNGQYMQISKKERDLMDKQKILDMERILDSTALKKMTQPGSKQPEKELDRLIGLAPVKQKVKEMVARMQFERLSKGKKGTTNSMSGRHMIFYGSPGTGKTTVARILTGFLYQYGYIKENKCVEVDGNFLKAGGDTATKTTLIVQQAFGGVLFIDEAYALMETGDGAGTQAIATLIKLMEDKRDRFILIMAGYTNEMQNLLRANPGFASRIKEYLDFPDYNDYEMGLIFTSMANSMNFAVSDGALTAFNERLQRERRLRSFGNGRTARNILDETIDRHALNLAENRLPADKRYMLCAEDVSRIPRQTIV